MTAARKINGSSIYIISGLMHGDAYQAKIESE